MEPQERRVRKEETSSTETGAEEEEEEWTEDWWCPVEEAGERPQLTGVAAEPMQLLMPNNPPSTVRVLDAEETSSLSYG